MQSTNEIKFTLSSQELDIVMRHLMAGQWQHVNGVITKMLTQANTSVPQPSEEPKNG